MPRPMIFRGFTIVIDSAYEGQEAAELIEDIVDEILGEDDWEINPIATNEFEIYPEGESSISDAVDAYVDLLNDHPVVRDTP